MTGDIPADLAPAYDECLRLVREHGENFPVASWLLPAAVRPHVAAIYAFARIADDFADEPGRTSDERLALLDHWEQKLRCPTDVPMLAALAHTRRLFRLPLEPFTDLLSAFRQDVTTARYDTWDELLDYCRRSANPVGRLVLRLFGYQRDELDRRADALCTALQLTNFWQDFEIDWRRGRVYLPAEIWEPLTSRPADLRNDPLAAGWRLGLAKATARTRTVFDEARPLCDLIGGSLRYELRATWLGGSTILDRLERADFNVAAGRPSLTMADALVIGWKTLTWRVTPRSITRS